MASSIIIEDVSFDYKEKNVLDGLSMEVPQGCVFGFLGRNGAGKTTTIRLMLGLLNAKKGEIKIAGQDPWAKGVDVRRKVGYMAEDQQMYGWMTVGQVIQWASGFYEKWDFDLTDNLVDIFGLSKKTKIKHLSKGQNSSLALLLSVGHHPEVVILDDPTLGLDPIARKDFLRHVIELMQSRGITVFFSSHLLYEIEPVADYVAILEGGKIIESGQTDMLRDNIARVIIGKEHKDKLKGFKGVIDVKDAGNVYAITVENLNENSTTIAAIKDAQVSSLNLDEIFEAYILGNKGA